MQQLWLLPVNSNGGTINQELTEKFETVVEQIGTIIWSQMSMRSLIITTSEMKKPQGIFQNLTTTRTTTMKNVCSTWGPFLN